MKRIELNSQSATTFLTTQTMTGIDLTQAEGVSIMATVTASTPAAKTFANTAVNTTDDQLTITSHGYVTGVVGQFTTSSALPGGISASTNYYIKLADANTVYIATSYLNAVNGVFVNISSQGTGNHTFTPTAASVVMQVQGSHDNVTYADIPDKNRTLTASGSYSFELDKLNYKYNRVQYQHSGGIWAVTSQTTELVCRP